MHGEHSVQTTDVCACLPTRLSASQAVFIRARTNQALSH